MIFDGMKFVRNHHIAARDWAHDDRYVEFYYPKTGRAIEMTGHSLTNMAYAKDGRVLLVKNGIVYTSGTRKRLLGTTRKDS